MEQFLRDHGTGTCPSTTTTCTCRSRSTACAGGGLRRRCAADPGIALIGTLDTKGAEIAYVRDRLRALGVRPLVVDSGILGEADGLVADVPREEVARAGGHDLEAIRAAGSRGAAVALMLEGVRAVVLREYTAGRIAGVLCLGGAEGALLGAAAMHALPVGVPKLIVSPSASGRRPVRPVRGRGRRDGHALGDRHPRPQRDLARDLRQRGGRGRRHGARRRRGRSAASASAASASPCSARPRRA